MGGDVLRSGATAKRGLSKLLASISGFACWTALAAAASPTLPYDSNLMSDHEGPAAPEVPKLPLNLLELEGPLRSGEQVAAEAEKLLLAGRYDEARPLLAELANFPDMKLHSSFMEGYLALQQKDLPTAEARLRRAVDLRPDYTRARVELGQALLGQGKKKAADEQFQIAERDKSLPPDILDVIKQSRRMTADRLGWHLNLDAAVSADSNINNGTDLELVEVDFGNGAIPVEVNPAVRREDGFGRSASANGSLRVRTGDRTTAAFDLEAYASDFDGSASDEASLQFALGPQVRFTSGGASIQALVYQRWYGGSDASAGIGLRGRYQTQLEEGERLYLYVESRVFESAYGDDFSGWQANGVLAYEDVINDDLAWSVSINGRREWLGSETFSSSEFGGQVGINLLVPFGLRLRGSAGLSRILYDAPLLRLSEEARRDWRLSSSLYLSTQRAVLLGLWPSVSYHYSYSASSIPFYDRERHRVRLGVRRGF
jgi:tetratricopeptide (TPR) repeat protein